MFLYTMKNLIQNNHLRMCPGLFCVLLLFGCARDTGSAREEGKTATITLEEVLRIGDEAAGDTILFRTIDQIAVNRSGDLLVAEGTRSPLVHAFDANGAYLRQIGAQGEGPGEWQYGIDGPVVGKADSVYLMNLYPRQIFVYDPVDFSFVRSIALVAEGENQFGFLIGTVTGGWYVTYGLPAILDSEDGSIIVNEDQYSELIKINRDGSYDTDPLGRIPAMEMIYHIYPEGGGFAFLDVPFGRSGVYRVGPDDLLYHGWSENIEIAIVSADGSVRDTIRYAHDPVPITDSEIAEASKMENEVFQQIMDDHHEPHETKPGLQTFLVDERSRVWVKLSRPEGATEAEWLIVNRQSQAVARATLPATVDLQVIQGGYAYGVQQGGSDDPMVVVYEIQE